jgi:hypothetical protein
LKIRVVLGTAPEEPIEDVQELLPTVKVLEDEDNLDTTTEVLAIYPMKYSSGKFSISQYFFRVF